MSTNKNTGFRLRTISTIPNVSLSILAGVANDEQRTVTKSESSVDAIPATAFKLLTHSLGPRNSSLILGLEARCDLHECKLREHQDARIDLSRKSCGCHLSSS
jgi:hypothetical protein